MAAYRFRRSRIAHGNDLMTLKVCHGCGARLVLRNFPKLPGENRRSDACNCCLRFPSVSVRTT